MTKYWPDGDILRNDPIYGPDGKPLEEPRPLGSNKMPEAHYKGKRVCDMSREELEEAIVDTCCMLADELDRASRNLEKMWEYKE